MTEYVDGVISFFLSFLPSFLLSIGWWSLIKICITIQVDTPGDYWQDITWYGLLEDYKQASNQDAIQESRKLQSSR